MEVIIVLRPIDSSLSILNSEQRANQAKDQSAHHVQTLQQDEIAKRIQHEARSVQPADKGEGSVKVRDRKDDRNKDERRNKKKRDQSASADESEESAVKSARHDGGGVDFLA
jgi:hypothetical protein